MPAGMRLRLTSTMQAARPRVVCQRRYASHGAPSYNEPTGYLFGEKPPPPGQKRKREGWETIYYWGMFGSLGTAAVLLYIKPDTSIQTWALQEAKARMEARGDLPRYVPSADAAAGRPSS
ncbi:ESSS subunit of NADH:ubiquinone oxidoreductase-domain-containing protein [Auriculariales sp. MPI-PUGE-AT-0066]|nr:ESSS subunit of NADH:ubiquinone oxidoreductase-domain-containing protein [Auriculariales sp. MPI-PUGE-AT-0066]